MIALTSAMRVIHLAASLLLVGVLAFLLLVVGPADRAKQSGHQNRLGHIDYVVRRVMSWSLLTMLVSGACGLWTQLVMATGRSLLQALTVDDLWSILTDTQYGQVWIIRMVLMMLLGGFLWLYNAEKGTRDRWALRLAGTALAISLLVTQAWMGHAATGAGWTLVSQVLADGLHLLASGIWLGGLPIFVYLLSLALRSEETSTQAIAAEATWRFSMLALFSVSVLSITGLANAWKLVGTVPALVGTTYGRLLLLKLGLFLLLLSLAVLNFFCERPRLAQAVHDQGHSGVQQSLRRLRRNVLVELVIGGCILLIVVALGRLLPGYHDQPTWPFSFRLSWDATQEVPGVRISVAIGIAMAMCGCGVMLLAAITRMRYWLRIVLVGAVMAGVGCMVWLPKVAVKAYPTTYLRPTIPYDAVSLATGLRLYSEHCAVCHGVNGGGDEPAAPGRRPGLTDLTAPQTVGRTAGDIFWWLTHGKPGTAMPGFADRLTEEDRWDLINVVRALSATKQARLLSPRVGTNLWLVAPDFSYATAQRQDMRTLADYRGRTQVLLVFFTLPHSVARLVQLRDIYPQVQARGGDILGIPLEGGETAEHMVTRLKIPFSIATDGVPEVAVAYTFCCSRAASEESQLYPPTPSHVELLIDRAGYLRARWIPQETTGWGKITHLLSTIDQLNQEKNGVPGPDPHGH